jgi:hypothetical protein
MAKNFSVSVDITMAKTISVEAENENDAMNKVREMIDDNPYQYANNFSHYVTSNVVDAEEEEF